MVALALIGLLAALLLPALSRAKHAARRVQCASNLRQLGLAAQMYWDDNGGKAFRYRGVSTNGGDIFWFGWLARGEEGKRAFDPTAGALFPYVSGRGVETCPSLNYTFRQFKLKASGEAYGYGYNISLSAPLDQPPVDIGRIQRLSDTVLFADAAQVNVFQAPATPSTPMLEEFYYVSTNEPTAHFRHSRRANVVFCDGHVAHERMAIDSLDARLPGQLVGRLRSEILVVP